MYDNYDFVYTKNLNSINLGDDNIYYLYDYYKKWWVDKYPSNQKIRDNFFTFMSIKKGNYSSYRSSLRIGVALCNFFKLLDGEWIICTVPGHEKTKNESNPVYSILSNLSLNSNFTLQNTLIQRSSTVDKKATSSDRVTDYREDMRSLKLENSNLKNKNILVIDDITTTGCSLIACRTLLLNAHAKNVVCLAIGKTKEVTYYGYY